MYRYIISIALFILFLIVTLVNLGNQSYVSLNFIFFHTPNIPGIILFYLGLAAGAVISIPAALYHTKKKNSKVLNQHIKKETKRMKKNKKNEDSSHVSGIGKGNINSINPQKASNVIEEEE